MVVVRSGPNLDDEPGGVELRGKTKVDFRMEMGKRVRCQPVNMLWIVGHFFLLQRRRRRRRRRRRKKEG